MESPCLIALDVDIIIGQVCIIPINIIIKKNKDRMFDILKKVSTKIPVLNASNNDVI